MASAHHSERNAPIKFCAYENSERIKRAKGLLGSVGLKHYFKKKVEELSGGEKQRVAIARALVADAKYIFADEPMGALDNKTSNDIIDLLLRINARGKTLIIVTHDTKIAERCSKVITLSDGMLI